MITQVKRGWRADFWLGAQRIRKTLLNKKLAQAFEVTKKTEFLQGKLIPRAKGEKVTFRQFADEYYQTHSIVKHKDPKREEYRLKYLNNYFGDKRLADIRPLDIERWQGQMKARQKPSTVNRRLVTLKSMLNKAVKWGYLPASPGRYVSRLGGEEQRDRYLTADEIKKILKVAEPRIKIFFIFAINTGMRCDNIKTLTWKDVYWQSGAINVPKNKSDKAYSVPINNTVRGILQARAKLGTSGFVLDTTNLRKDFEKLREVAGIENCTIHDLRHTFASHLAMKGVDLYTIAKLLGHSDIKMTQRYAHLAPDHKSIAVNMLDFVTVEKQEVEWTFGNLKRSRRCLQIIFWRFD